MKRFCIILIAILCARFGWAQSFTEADETISPFPKLGAGFGAFSLADLDDDGDFDLTAVQLDSLFYFENIGNAQSPIFKPIDYTNSPFYALADSLIGTVKSLRFLDSDSDGDFDLAIELNSNSAICFVENTGTASSPFFKKTDALANPLRGLSESGIDFSDLDNDGDPDAAGIQEGELFLRRNYGSVEKPNYFFPDSSDFFSPRSSGSLMFNMTITARADSNGLSSARGNKICAVIDGEIRGLASSVNIRGGSYFFLMVHDSGFKGSSVDLFHYSAVDNLVRPLNYSRDFFADKRLGSVSNPVILTPQKIQSDAVRLAFTDIELDGDRDLIVANNAGKISLLRNTGSPDSAKFEMVVISPFSGLQVRGLIQMNFADVDGDGDDDFLFTDSNGFLRLYFNGSSLLPVELTSFSAKVISGSVALSWKTESEFDNYGFEIQRKLVYGSIQGESPNDPESYLAIAFVPGRGNSNTPKNYSFFDDLALNHNLNLPQKIQYRLKQIDFDGEFEYSDVVEVSMEFPEEFKLYQNYPKPFNPTKTIEFGLKERAKVSLYIYNVLGEIVSTLVNGAYEAGYYVTQWNSQSATGAKLASGIYVYRLIAEHASGNFIETKKFILLK